MEGGYRSGARRVLHRCLEGMAAAILAAMRDLWATMCPVRVGLTLKAASGSRKVASSSEGRQPVRPCQRDSRAGVVLLVMLAALQACGTADDATSSATVAAGSGGAGGTSGPGAGGAGGGPGGSGGGSSCQPTTGATVGLLLADAGAAPGYTLFAPLSSKTTYLIDNCGRQVHSWPGSASPGNVVYLLEDGDLLRTENVGGTDFKAGGAGGRVARLKWDGTVAWSYEYATSQHRQHHDAIVLPNGNVLMIAWEKKTAAEALAAGRDPANLKDELWADTLIEIQPTGTEGGTVVWEWHVWDHLIQDHDASKANYGAVADAPGRVDLNFGGMSEDWTHINSVHYNATLDQLVVSTHNFDEVWILDHGTTTSEAASGTGGKQGKGGEILYRWGNPAAYRAGTITDQQLFGQHDAQWIAAGLAGAGNLLVFNNGVGRPSGKFSSVEEIVTPVDGDGAYSLTGSVFGPDAPTWHYEDTPKQALFSANISGAHRLANGNTLICNGASGIFSEVTVSGAEVWRYQSPIVGGTPLAQGEVPPKMGGISVFRAYRYAPSYPGLAGHDLTAGDTIEE